jgi:signal transduction histidine kinase/CheY-like chemotaxis protein
MKGQKIIIFSLYLIMLAGLSRVESQNVPEKRHILVLNSYHEGLPWSRGLSRGFNSVFDASAQPLEIHVEYMDNIRHRDGVLLEDLQMLYRKKFEQIKLGAVVVTDDPALTFALTQRDTLFSDIPLFFCGPNDFKAARLEDLNNITGVAENPNMMGTVNLIRELHPGITEIAVVSDRNPGSVRVLQTLEGIELELDHAVKFRALTDTSMEALLEELKNLPSGTPVVFHAFLRDAAGTIYSSNLKVLEILSSAVKLPFYTFKKIDVGHGVVGGSVISEELMASLTAQMVLEYFNGTPLESIAPVIDTPQLFFFDADQLERFNISDSRLPEGSVIINQKVSFYQTNKALVWSIISVFSVLVCLVAILALNVRRRQRAEMQIKRANEELEKRVRERTDDLNAARKKAEAATRAKSDFLANMSHEIRTPMNAIIGLDNLLGRTQLNPKQKDYVDKIGSSAGNLLGIINDILDFSKIEAGKLEIENTTFVLNEILEDLSGMIGDKAREKGLELVFKQDQETPPYLVGDPLRLGQILLNITNNAIKFTEKGKIDVITKLHSKDINDVYLRFEVKDTGIGLTEEQAGNLFHSFTQADTSTTRKYGGTGLGLSISKRLVEMMDGEIGVESEYGKGSTFYFIVQLGVGEGKEKKSHLNLEGFDKVRGARILLVEDNEINQQVAKETLEQEGFFVDIAEDGRVGVEMLAKAGIGYELILMDLQMPVMDGYEATREIRKDDRFADLPIVAMTADAMTGVRDQVEAVGMNDYVTKPINPAELWGALAKWIKPGERKLPEGFEQVLETGVVEDEILIPPIEGFDIEDGLARVGGNRKLYRDLLIKFSEEFAGSTEDIRKSLEGKDRKSAERIAHTLKGAAGNLGAEELQEKAALLDSALKEATTGGGESMLSDFDTTLRSLISAIDGAGLIGKEEGPETPGPELTGIELFDLLKQLEPSLKKRQPKKCEPIFKTLRHYSIPREFESHILELEKQIGKYKFKDAQDILGNLIVIFEEQEK